MKFTYSPPFQKDAVVSFLAVVVALVFPVHGQAGDHPVTSVTNSTPYIKHALPSLNIVLPDLMPVGFTTSYTGTSQYFREYSATVSVANLGNKDAGTFACLFGMRVLSTDDAAKYPVGTTSYVGWVIFEGGVAMASLEQKSAGLAFVIPKEVTHCEIVVVTDRFMDSLANPGDWEDDSGDELIGNIQESNERNNISDAKVFRFLNLTGPVRRAQ